MSGRTSSSRRSHNLTRSGTLVALLVPLLTSHAAFARDWYVDGAYGNQNNPGTSAQPFRFFWQAENRAGAEDTIYLKPTTTYPTLYVTSGGKAAHPLTIMGSSSSNPTRVNGGGGAFGIWVGASYVTVSNFDVVAPGQHAALHVPDGIHHVTITHNRLHDSGGNGIDLVGTDYMNVSFNTVYGNAHDTSGHIFGSGISVKGSRDIDRNTGVKITINGNIVYANTNVPTGNETDSDGSGIIIDNTRRTYSDSVWYKGRTMISNNVIFGNGGRGVHLYLSDHIIVNGNTMYSNNQDYHEANWRPGEVTGDYVSDVKVYNNILYSDGNSTPATGKHVSVSFLFCGGTGPIDIQGNLGFSSRGSFGDFFYARANGIGVNVANNLWGNPQFVNQTLNSRYADFRVKSWSPAVRNALLWATLPKDLLGASRFHPATIGAYENGMF